MSIEHVLPSIARHHASSTSTDVTDVTVLTKRVVPFKNQSLRKQRARQGNDSSPSGADLTANRYAVA